MDEQWILCPKCHHKTRLRILADTVLKNFPLFCPKCKEETLIDAKQFHITIITGPDAELIGEAKSYRRTIAKRAAREVAFSDLIESELVQLFAMDEYESDYCCFQVSGFDVFVKNELLAEAINALPERKRKIILLSYFLDMSDEEIGAMMNVVRSTIFRHRKNALARMKNFMEGKKNDKHK